MIGQTVILHGRADSKPCAHCGREFCRDSRNTYAYWERAKYCSQDCAGKAWSKGAAERRAPMAEKFWSWVEKTDGCWLWRGAVNNKRGGYGAFSYGGKTVAAHVVALELDGRKPKKGEYACHHCDNPQCVRPDHLYPGTPTMNMADARRRGRTCQGEKQHMAKLTAERVCHIRASDAPNAELAALYGVSPSNIQQVRKRKTWRHLP